MDVGRFGRGPARGARANGHGRCHPSEYGEPYVITRRLIEDGRDQPDLRDPLSLPFPVRLLQGTADIDVPVSVGLRLLRHIDCPDAHLTIVKDADHRFSAPETLALLTETIERVA
jgi:pimeloyl-ACP methyl ester carboxylesterase